MPPDETPPDDDDAHGERKSKDSSLNYEVGFGSPPKHSRWKKGECGNPKRIRKRTAKSVVTMIDEFFAGEITIVQEGVSRRVSHFEAIFLQLLSQAGAGKKRAMNILLQYQAFATVRGGRMGGQQIELVVEHGADSGGCDA
jgi:hypothetical protein